MAVSETLLSQLANPQVTDYTKRFQDQRLARQQEEANAVAIQDARNKLRLAALLDPLAVEKARLDNQGLAQTQDINAQKLPLELQGLQSETNLRNATSNRLSSLLPGEIAGQQADIDLTGAQAGRISALLPLEMEGLQSETNLRNETSNRLSSLLPGEIAGQQADVYLKGSQVGRINSLLPLEMKGERARIGLLGAQTEEYRAKREAAKQFGDATRRFLAGEDDALGDAPPDKVAELVETRNKLREDPAQAKKAARAASAAAGILQAPEEERPALYDKLLKQDLFDEEDEAFMPAVYGEDAEQHLQVFADSFRNVDKIMESNKPGKGSTEEEYQARAIGKEVGTLKAQYKVNAVGANNFLRKIAGVRKLAQELEKAGGFGPIDANGKVQATGRALNTKEQAIRDRFQSAVSDLELDVAKMKLSGQGQVTEAERAIARATLPNVGNQNGDVALSILGRLEEDAQNIRATEKKISSFKGKPSDFIAKFNTDADALPPLDDGETNVMPKKLGEGADPLGLF